MIISGKNIILTGASSGIGLEILKLLIQFEGVKVIAVARHIETIPSKKGVVFTFSADMSCKEGIDSLFRYTSTVFDEVDLFISNAGFAYMEKLTTPDWQHIQNIFSLNTFAPIYSIQKMLESRHSNRSKIFVCNISAVADVPLPYYSLYCSTKAAINQFINTYRYESEKGLKIISVYPVATRTPFFQKATYDDKPILPFLSQEPHTVARSIIKGIVNEKNNIYPSTLFLIFKKIGQVYPFIFRLYSLHEKKKVNKYHKL